MNINEKNGPVAEAERYCRLAAAEAEADRLIDQARKLNRATAVIVVSCIAAFLVGWNWPGLS